MTASFFSRPRTPSAALFRAALASAALVLSAAPLRAQTVIMLDPEALRAQAMFQQGGRKEEVARVRNEIINLWFRHRLHIEERQFDLAAQALDEIKSLSVKSGVDESTLLAFALLYQGYQFHEVGNLDAALQSFDWALDFNPSLYAAHQAKARAHFRQNPYKVFQYALDAVRALEARFGDVWATYYLACNTLIALFVAVAVWALAVIAGGVVRHFRLVYHEIFEACRARLPREVAVLLGGVIMFLPAFLWLGFLWFALYWVILFWRYFRATERLAAAAFLVWLACLVPAVYLVKHLTLMATDAHLRASVSAITGGFDETRLRLVRELFEKDPRNADLAFTLATLYKNGGFVDEAKRHLHRVIELKSDFIPAYINLGNLHFYADEFAEALRHYRRANDIRPTALAYYNMHAAHNKRFEFALAEEALTHANDINPRQTAQYTAAKEPVVDATMDMRALRAQFFRVSRSGFEEAAASAVSFSAFKNPFTFLALATAALAATLAWATRKARLAFACVKCGRAGCDKCRVGIELETYCSQCSHLFVKRDGVSPTVRNRKLYEIERYQRRQRWVAHALNAIIPGSGSMHAGEAWVGALLLALWSVGAAVAAAEPWLMSDPLALVTSFHVRPLHLGAIIAAVAWLFANPWRWIAGGGN